ncbi:unnamed protein product, partial [Polarella glacialis]
MLPLLLPDPAGALCLPPPGLDRQPRSAEDWSRLCMKDPVNTIPFRRPHVVESEIHRQDEEPLESDQLSAQQAVDQLCIAKATIVALCSCATGILVTWRSSWLEGVSARRLELYATFELALPILVVLHLDFYYAGKWQGLSSDEIGSALGDMYFSDSRVLLCWALITVIAHVHLPIRWCLLIWVEIAVLLSYLVCIALGSPEGFTNVAIDWVTLLALILSAAAGKRHVEYLERLSMLALISEKTMRFQSEFQLERMSSQSTTASNKSKNNNSNNNNNNNNRDNEDALSDTRSHDHASMVSSVEKMSDIVFEIDIRVEDASRALHFRAMAKMGQSEHWLIEADQLQCFPEQLLGRGSFGVVVAGEFLGAPVATKLNFALHTLSLSALSSELRIFRRLRHPNIVMFQGACIIPDSVLLILVE